MSGKAGARARKGKQQQKRTMDPVLATLEKGLTDPPKGGIFGPVQMMVLAKYIVSAQATIEELQLELAAKTADDKPTNKENDNA